MKCLSEILKVEFTPNNERVICAMLATCIRDSNTSCMVRDAINSTIVDIRYHGINSYHYKVVELAAELQSNLVLGF